MQQIAVAAFATPPPSFPLKTFLYYMETDLRIEPKSRKIASENESKRFDVVKEKGTRSLVYFTVLFQIVE